MKKRELSIEVLINLEAKHNTPQTIRTITGVVHDHFEDVYHPEEMFIRISLTSGETGVEIRSLVDKNMDEFVFDPDLTEKVVTAIGEAEE